MLYPNLGRGCVVHPHQNSKRLDSVGTFTVKGLIAAVHGVGTTHAGTNENASTNAVNICECTMRTLYRLVRREHREQTEPVPHTGLGRVEVRTFNKLSSRRDGRYQPACKWTVKPTYP